MTEQKLKRVVKAVTVGAVLLIMILCSVLGYQLIKIAMSKKQLNELNDQIEYYETLNQEKNNILEARQKRWWIERRARELGYTYNDDINLGE